MMCLWRVGALGLLAFALVGAQQLDGVDDYPTGLDGGDYVDPVETTEAPEPTTEAPEDTTEAPVEYDSTTAVYPDYTDYPEGTTEEPVETTDPVEATTAAPVTDAVDTNPSCCGWAKKGECVANPFWMFVNCPVACGTPGAKVYNAIFFTPTVNPNCAPVAPPPPPVRPVMPVQPVAPVYPVAPVRPVAPVYPVAPIHPGPAPSPSCQNKNPSCPGWAKAGECSKNPDYMNIYCASSCNTCPLPPDPNCDDNPAYPRCKYWAKTGECARNAGFMHKECKKSCSLCGAAAVQPMPQPAPIQAAPVHVQPAPVHVQPAPAKSYGAQAAPVQPPPPPPKPEPTYHAPEPAPQPQPQPMPQPAPAPAPATYNDVQPAPPQPDPAPVESHYGSAKTSFVAPTGEQIKGTLMLNGRRVPFVHRMVNGQLRRVVFRRVVKRLSRNRRNRRV